MADLTPAASSAAVRSRMCAQRIRDTAPELAVRRAMHALGLRYRLGRRVLGCRPDAVFPTERVAVFVDGCFWHGCPDHSRPVKANGAWWAAKIRRTAERDTRQTATLAAAGWSVVRAWEHDDPGEVARAVLDQVVSRRAGAA